MQLGYKVPKDVGDRCPELKSGSLTETCRVTSTTGADGEGDATSQHGSEGQVCEREYFGLSVGISEAAAPGRECEDLDPRWKQDYGLHHPPWPSTSATQFQASVIR